MPKKSPQKKSQKKPENNFSNGKIAVILSAVVFSMVGLSFAAVPLYDLFCRVTGLGGTTQVASENTTTVLEDRVFQVSFDANIDKSLPWRFVPAATVKGLPAGESKQIFFTAENLSDEMTVGQATFNVTPLKAAKYFYKVQCFCFTNQPLKPGEKADMGVQFYIDPKIREDRNLDDVKAITLSYTMYDFS